MKRKYSFILLSILILALASSIVILSIKISLKPHYAVKMNTALAKETTVTLTNDGFSPKEVTIKAGTAIRWKNATKTQQTVNSDNYPTNQLHKELNFGVFNSGSTVVHVFTTPGTYGYHNQFHPEQKGKIIVE